MASSTFRVGGLHLTIRAGASGAGFGINYSGRAWDRFVDFVRNRRAGRAAAPLADSPLPLAVAAPRVTDGAAADSGGADAQALVDSIWWYHSFDFGNGVRALGQFDHAPILERYRLPATFAGKRVLDVATFDGYWAFEFERRGAREVIALDLDRPADLDVTPARLAAATPEELAVRFGRGFAVAHRLLRSRVQRVVCNVYDLAPERFGMFDVVHAGDVLLHLNSPVRALQNIARVCTEYAIISDVFHPDLEALGPGAFAEYLGGHSDVTWWRFSLPMLRQMVKDAGFATVEVVNTFRYGQRGQPEGLHHVVLKAIK